MFTECTIQYDTKKWGDIYVFCRKTSLVFLFFFFIGRKNHEFIINGRFVGINIEESGF